MCETGVSLLWTIDSDFFTIAFKLCTYVYKDFLHFTLNVALINYITRTVVNGKVEEIVD